MYPLYITNYNSLKHHRLQIVVSPPPPTTTTIYQENRNAVFVLELSIVLSAMSLDIINKTTKSILRYTVCYLVVIWYEQNFMTWGLSSSPPLYTNPKYTLAYKVVVLLYISKTSIFVYL